MPHAALGVVVAAASLTAQALGLGGCGDDSPAPPSVAAVAPPTRDASPTRDAAWFRDEAAARGIDFVHHSGASGEFWMPEMACPGCALFDMDGDGDLDALLIESDGVTTPRAQRRGNRLYRNAGDGTFQDATPGSGVETRLFGMGAACGDYDNDGDTDLLLTGQDGIVLLRNDGTGRFTDVSAESGVASTDWGTSAAFFDYDGDGDL
ncbi:MAG: VCBS repeat-containing protein, partial [Planctomycetes bacterium]|nr:VCBS repeat-containing protein [Planctomycetota bacterium]